MLIRSCALDAASRHGVAHDSPLRAYLEANGVIGAGNNSLVVMKTENSLDVEIENWLSAPRPATAVMSFAPPGRGRSRSSRSEC